MVFNLNANLHLLSQGGMTTSKNQPKQVIIKMLAYFCLDNPPSSNALITFCADCSAMPDFQCVSPLNINGFIPTGRHQPGNRIARETFTQLYFEHTGYELLQNILSCVDVPQETNEGGQRTRVRSLETDCEFVH